MQAEGATWVLGGCEYLWIGAKTVVPLRAGLCYDPEPFEGSAKDFCAVAAGTGLVYGPVSPRPSGRPCCGEAAPFPCRLKGHLSIFQRTSVGAEIDLVLVPGRGKPVAVVVKHSSAPSPGKGFWIAYRDLGWEQGFEVFPGDEAHPLGEGVTAVPVGGLGDI